MRAQSIVVLGGTGFLGTRLVARLIKDGRRVTVLSRDREQHKHLLVLPGLTLENCDVYAEAQLSEHFRGKDVVINLIGILNERGFSGSGFRRAHTELTRGVLQASRSAGVTRLLQVANRLDQQPGWQGRAIGIDQANRPVARGEQIARSMDQAPPERRLLRRQQLEAFGQQCGEKPLRAPRVIGGEALDRCPSCCGSDVRRDIGEEAGIEFRCFLRGQRWHEPRLDGAGNGCLGHDGDRAQSFGHDGFPRPALERSLGGAEPIRITEFAFGSLN